MEPLKTVDEPDDRDKAAFRHAVAEGLTSAKREPTIPYADVRKWLLSWGKEDELPPPECG